MMGTYYRIAIDPFVQILHKMIQIISLFKRSMYHPPHISNLAVPAVPMAVRVQSLYRLSKTVEVLN